jgi:hypothetical protein
MNRLGFKHLLALSLALFALSGEFFYYRAFAAPRGEAASGLQALTSLLAGQAQAPAAEAVSAEASSATMPDLLARVQELALSSGVSVASIEPQGSNTQFRITLDSSYAGLIRFMTRFEALQVAVAGFEMARPQDSHLLRTVVDFSHTSTPPTVRPRTIAEFEAKLRSETLLDPFDPQAGALAFMLDRDPNDLTWTFHLTSISEIGDRRYATIDGRDYEQGDRLDGREISSIGDDTVTLKEPVTGGEKRLFLRFRDALTDRT